MTIHIFSEQQTDTASGFVTRTRSIAEAFAGNQEQEIQEDMNTFQEFYRTSYDCGNCEEPVSGIALGKEDYVPIDPDDFELAHTSVNNNSLRIDTVEDDDDVEFISFGGESYYSEGGHSFPEAFDEIDSVSDSIWSYASPWFNSGQQFVVSDETTETVISHKIFVARGD